MNRGLSALALAALLAAGIAGGVGLSARLDRNGDTSPGSVDAALTLQSAYNRAASIATKAVVHLTLVEGRVPENVGSGVIVSKEGHIVTNYHVVRQMQGDSCVVRFVDGAEFEATLRGFDEESDLAVLKIDAGGRVLHPIVFADSDKARVGDLVFAIGSPFGYTHTVTSGIVSAKHRILEMGRAYEDYLQTDAAINPGNSGGALVNLRGELLGVNSAMVSGSRTNDGVGLAIASNLVKWVQERLIRDGQVRRGFLGIDIIDVELKTLRKFPHLVIPRLAGTESQEDLVRRLGLPDGSGALVVGVREGGAAELIPLRELDVVSEFDGRAIRNVHELIQRVVEMEPGRTVKLKFVRAGKVQEATATLKERPRPAIAGAPVPAPPKKNKPK